MHEHLHVPHVAGLQRWLDTGVLGQLILRPPESAVQFELRMLAARLGKKSKHAMFSLNSSGTRLIYKHIMAAGHANSPS